MCARVVAALGGLAVAAAASLLLPGCARLPFAAQSPGQLASGGFGSWSTSPGFLFSGRLSADEGTLRFTVLESRHGARGKGTGTLDGKPFTYLATPGNQYLKGQPFWEEYCRTAILGCGRPVTGADTTQGVAPEGKPVAEGIEDRWAQATITDVASSLKKLTSLGGDITDLRSASRFRKAGTRTIDGREATELTDHSGDSFWVAQGSPDQVVGFRGDLTDDGMHKVDVTIAFTTAPRVTEPTPGQTVDPDAPSTLPALYQVIFAGASVTCAARSCPVSALVQNQAGAPQGTNTVQISTRDMTRKTAIASCTANIPATPAGEEQSVSCTITGPAWTAWARENTDAYGVVLNLTTTAQITADPPYVR